MATPNTASRDKFMASLRQIRRQLRRRSAVRSASSVALIALASATLVQTMLALASYLTPNQAFTPNAALTASLIVMPTLAVLVSGLVAYLAPLPLVSAARWADQILGGDTLTTTLSSSPLPTTSIFDGALLAQANRQLDAMPQLPSLRLDKHALTIASLTLIFLVSGIVHWLVVPPPSIDIEDDRLIRVDPLNATQGLLGTIGAPAQQAAQALGLNDTARAIGEAQALSELLASGELNQAQALAQLSDIENMLGDSQGLDALGALLENEHVRNTLEGLLSNENPTESPTGPELMAKLAGVLGTNGLSDELGELLENIDPKLLDNLVKRGGQLESIESVVRARSTLLAETKKLRQKIVASSTETSLEVESTTSLEGATLTRETTGKDLRTITRDAMTSIERLPLELRRDAERYLSKTPE